MLKNIQNIENNNVTAIKIGNSFTCYYTDSLLRSFATTINKDPLTRKQYTDEQVRFIYDRASQKARNDYVQYNQINLDYSDYTEGDLYLDNNQIVDVSQLTLPKSLERLGLSGNRISNDEFKNLRNRYPNVEINDTIYPQLSLFRSMSVVIITSWHIK